MAEEACAVARRHAKLGRDRPPVATSSSPRMRPMHSRPGRSRGSGGSCRSTQDPAALIMSSGMRCTSWAGWEGQNMVMIFVDNAVSEGLAPSLAHPSGNITGLSLPYAEVSGKRLEFLVPV